MSFSDTLREHLETRERRRFERAKSTPSAGPCSRRNSRRSASRSARHPRHCRRGNRPASRLICLLWVTGGKTPSKYIFSELPR